MRRPDDVVLTVTLSARERDYLDQMRQVGPFSSDANLVREALWSLADDLQLDPPQDMFGLRRPTGRPARHRDTPAPPRRLDRLRPQTRRAMHAGAHPWNGRKP